MRSCGLGLQSKACALDATMSSGTSSVGQAHVPLQCTQACWWRLVRSVPSLASIRRTIQFQRCSTEPVDNTEESGKWQMHSRQALNLVQMCNAGSFRSAPGMASSRRTTASTEHDGAGGERAESFTSARSFRQTSLHSARSDALSTQVCRSPGQSCSWYLRDVQKVCQVKICIHCNDEW